MKRVIIIVFTCLAGYFLSSCASTNTPSVSVALPPLTYLKSHSIYTVQQNALYTLEINSDIKINSQLGISQLSKMRIRISEDVEKVDVNYAYVTSATGVRRDISADSIRIEAHPSTEKSALFRDRKYKTIHFSDLRIGDIVSYRLLRTMTQPLFAGQFYEYRVASPQYDWQSYAVSLQAPANFDIHMAANLIPGGEVPSETPNTRRWHWQREAIAHRVPNTDGSPHALNTIPYVLFSTFDNHSQITKAYSAMIAPYMKPSAKIGQLANELTQGVEAPKLQAQKLYDFVNAKIQPTWVIFGYGSVVPHSPEQTLEAEHGDSKNKAILLRALLNAKNIKSQIILLNIFDVYDLPPIATPSTFFNHMMLYLPETNTYLDPMSGHLPFGSLNAQVAGKPFLIFDESGQATIKKMPGLPIVLPPQQPQFASLH